MNFFSYIKEAFWMLLQNKMRSFLSLLGIVIGISSVVVLTAVGNGVKNSMAKNISSSQNVIRIEKGSIANSNISFSPNMQNNDPEKDPSIEQKVASEKIFTQETIEELQKIFKNSVKAIVPVIEFGTRSIVIGGQQQYFSVKLAEKSLFEAKNIKTERWMLFDKTSEPVVVIGWGLVKYFENKDPIGKSIFINNTPFTVIGIIEQTKDYVTDWSAYIPHVAATERFWKQKIQSIEVHAHSVDDINEIQKNLWYFLMKYSWAFSPWELNFHLSTDQKFIEMIMKQINQLALFISWIAAISLLVWGIGIMNIMLVSVTERTREIGIRKAIWAKRSDIIFQFLTESAMLSLLWGIIAIILSYFIGFIIGYFFPNFAPEMSIQIIIIATTFSIGMWVFFGLMPAWKAAKMNAIDALRFE